MRFPAAFLILIAPLLAAAEPGPAPRAVRLDLDGEILPPGVIARLGSTRFQESSARRVTVTPDGTRAVCVDDVNVRVWDLKSGKLLHVWPLPDGVPDPPASKFVDGGPTDFVGTVSEDGRTAVRLAQRSSGGVVGVAEVWDLPSGRKVRAFTADNVPAFTTAAISPDGRLVAAADIGPRPRQVHVWDVQTGGHRIIGAHDALVLGLHFVDGRRKLLVQVHDGDTCAHDLESGTVAYRVKVPGTYRLVVSRGGGRFVLFAPPRTWTVCDAATGKPVPGLKYPVPNDYSVPRALSDDGGTLVALRTVHTGVWDLVAGKERFGLPHHDQSAVAFGPGDRTLTFAGGGLWVRDTTTGKELAGPDPARGPPGGSASFGWSPDGSSLFVAGPRRTPQTVYDPKTGKVLRQLGPDAVVSGWYRPGLHSVPLTWDRVQGRLPGVLFNPPTSSTGKPVHGSTTLSGDTRLLAIRSVRPDFSHLIAATDMPPPDLRPKKCFDVAVHERLTGVELFRLEIPAAGEVAFSRDNRRLAVLEPDRLRVWDTFTAKELVVHRVTRPDRPPPGQGFGSALAFSPDNGRLAVYHRDGTILVWDVAVPETLDLPAAADLPRLWDQLAAADPKVAWRSAHRLALVPDRAIPFLVERIRPIQLTDATARRLLADLDSPVYRTREATMKRVLELGEAARPFLDAALKEATGAELQKRLQDLRGMLKEDGPPRGDDLRRLRVLYVLERIDTKDARAQIEELANGRHSVRVTLEAKQVRLRLADDVRAAKD